VCKVVTYPYPDDEINHCVDGINDLNLSEGPFEQEERSLGRPQVKYGIFINMAGMQQWREEKNDERQHDHKKIFVETAASGDKDEPYKDKENRCKDKAGEKVDDVEIKTFSEKEKKDACDK